MNSIKKLSKEEFNSTFIPPMNFMDVEDETSEVNLKPFVESVIDLENLNKSINEFTIDSIYHNANKSFEHVLLNYGTDNVFLVIVIELRTKDITGYHILDLTNNVVPNQ